MESGFTCAGVTEAASAQRKIECAGSLFNHPLINDRSVCGEEIERDGSSTHRSVVGSVDLHQRRSVAVMHGEECVEQPTCQTHDAFVDGFYANIHEMLEADFYGG